MKLLPSTLVAPLPRLLTISALSLATAAVAPASAWAQDAAAQPAPVVGQPPASPGGAPPTAPAADKAGAEQKAEDAPLMWRGTSFTWNQSVSTTTVGIGRDNIGTEDDVYTWDFFLSPNIYLLDLPKDKISAFAELGVGVEWTDSGSTTTQREPQFRDTQVGLGYNRTIYKSDDNEWSTGAAVRARYAIPTSKISLNQGRYGVVSLGGSLSQKFRLLGNAAAGLNNLSVIAGVTWSHLFARSYTPTNGGLERTRQAPSGQTLLSDQLSFRSMDIDRVIPSVTATLPLYKDLSLTTQFRLISRFRHDFEGNDCEVIVMGECQQADRLDDRSTYFTDSSFDVSLSQPIYDMFQINIGYNNETLTLGEDGKSRNIFYSPSAVFYLDLVVNIDTIYEKASGRSEIDLPPGPRQTLTVAESTTGMPSL